ncbi:hypothetical protein BATDEDRAFT_90854 [Batrachochytrium dendrobatidis JAM81]|uniref:Uncharacterized protein n=1 Tax=Batrachochytrium dendrobatidis (strain JAM81 / FGSC 10211) TaxID=684364 RepID=F4P9D0_BATDJ|nr:uncharacterized protein BATDEDRAFT_90854 [Batrachochytrium dendrobatidis JAM81]EGF78382.1 hypothetical protein BATDEDRAFT_90854 [Batrachochytrium dendrobatidis JAM81]|eukprot:XP_006681296.1 hypothetical protein BATDEDRAFT_90854 [Batrachochytrium dendrobatidis JAM81]
MFLHTSQLLNKLFVCFQHNSGLVRRLCHASYCIGTGWKCKVWDYLFLILYYRSLRIVPVLCKKHVQVFNKSNGRVCMTMHHCFHCFFRIIHTFPNNILYK